MYIGPTVAGISPDRFLRPAPGLRLIGVLSPLVGTKSQAIHIEEEELVVGRDDSCDVVVADQLVSRQHARITRCGEDFLLEDAGSINGTFVDGVPIVSCYLHDGDIVQFGKTLYYFDRLYVRSDAHE